LHPEQILLTEYEWSRRIAAATTAARAGRRKEKEFQHDT
jgi:hypothetical protein